MKLVPTLTKVLLRGDFQLKNKLLLNIYIPIIVKKVLVEVMKF